MKRLLRIFLSYFRYNQSVQHVGTMFYKVYHSFHTCIGKIHSRRRLTQETTKNAAFSNTMRTKKKRMNHFTLGSFIEFPRFHTFRKLLDIARHILSSELIQCLNRGNCGNSDHEFPFANPCSWLYKRLRRFWQVGGKSWIHSTHHVSVKIETMSL